MRVLHICILAFLFTGSSTALSQNKGQKVKGNLKFYPSQNYADTCVQLRIGAEEDGILYNEGQTDTELPFNFSVPVGAEICLEDLYVKVLVRVPKGFCCKFRNLRASESERLTDIPIHNRDDLFYSAKLKMKAAIDLGDIKESKKRLADVQSWATNAEQVVIPCLDVADFLSKHKSERGNVVKILIDAKGWVGDSNIGVQKRYWRLRRDATMRFAGYNDFKEMPVVQFAESVGELKNLNAAKAWMGFTISFAQAYEENEDKWTAIKKEKLAQDILKSLGIHYPRKQEVLGQLKAMEPVLGPTVVSEGKM